MQRVLIARLRKRLKRRSFPGWVLAEAEDYMSLEKQVTLFGPQDSRMSFWETKAVSSAYDFTEKFLERREFTGASEDAVVQERIKSFVYIMKGCFSAPANVILLNDPPLVRNNPPKKRASKVNTLPKYLKQEK